MTDLWAGCEKVIGFCKFHNYLTIAVIFATPLLYGHFRKGWRWPNEGEWARMALAAVGMWAAGSPLLEIWDKPSSDTTLAQALGAGAIALYAWSDIRKIMKELAKPVTPELPDQAAKDAA
jgi:hypothetical protein